VWAYIINNKCEAQKVREERCKHKITPKCVVEEETKVLDEKSHCGPSN